MDEVRREHLAGPFAGLPSELAIDHGKALLLSSRITTNLRQMYRRKSANIQPQDVIKVLNRAKIKFVLMGAHAIAGWLDEPRATQDIDILVQVNYRKAVQVIRNAFPGLTVHDLAGVTRFVDPTNGLPMIDLIKSQSDLHKLVPRNVFQVGKTYRIPDLEMALTLKFAAMQAPNRPLKKRYLDRADFLGIVTRNQEVIDTDKLFRLGEQVKRGGGSEIIKLVNDARTEEAPDLE